MKSSRIPLTFLSYSPIKSVQEKVCYKFIHFSDISYCNGLANPVDSTYQQYLPSD